MGGEPDHSRVALGPPFGELLEGIAGGGGVDGGLDRAHVSLEGVPGAPEGSAETTARDGLALMLGSGVRAINLAGGGVVRLEDFFAQKR